MHETEIRAVDWVRRIREAHYAKVKNMTAQEKIAFFREKSGALHAQLGRTEKLPQEPVPTPNPGKSG